MKPKAPDTRVTVRLTHDERKVLEVQAGDIPLSRYIRETVLGKAASNRKKRKTAPIKDHIALAQILALLGNHELVREFRKANDDVEAGIESVEPETARKIEDCHSVISKIHMLLINALGISNR